MRDMSWFGMGPSSRNQICACLIFQLLTYNQHLGRAKDVSEYVKHGSQEAMIEIELAKDGKRFKSNLVISCTIKREGNKTVFAVNGKPQGKRAVVELARSMSIQIDNLCQFLPQDKVVEFAAMTPVELLRSTQRAVASQEMIDTHEELKDLRRKQKDLQTRMNGDQDTLRNLEGRQRLQEADVERMREREQVVKRVEMLEIARPTVQYRRAKDSWKEAKERKKTGQDELGALRHQVEPSLRAVNRKQGYKQQIDVVVKERKDMIAKATERADKIDRRFQTLHDENNELDQAIAAEKEASVKYRKEAVRLESVLRDQQIQLQHAPPDVDIAACNDQLVSLVCFRTLALADGNLRSVRNGASGKMLKGRSETERISKGTLKGKVGRKCSAYNTLNKAFLSWIPRQENKTSSFEICRLIPRDYGNGYSSIPTILRSLSSDLRLSSAP